VAALSFPLALHRRPSHRRSVFEYLAMAVVTIAIFVVVLLAIERVTDTPLVSRIFAGTIGARTRADYSVTIAPRIKPLRPGGATVATPVATVGGSR
jgi:hypothetical protein